MHVGLEEEDDYRAKVEEGVGNADGVVVDGDKHEGLAHCVDQ